jgi:hypothetical protein
MIETIHAYMGICQGKILRLFLAPFGRSSLGFAGPVFDPRDVYGILVVRAASEDEARALGNGDPAVKSGMVKTEVAEMRMVFMPKGSAQ